MINRTAPAASTVPDETRPVSNEGMMTWLVIRPRAMVVPTAAAA